MSARNWIENEVAALSGPLQREVCGFARFLRNKSEDEPFNGLLWSEPAPARNRNKLAEAAASVRV